MNESSFADSPLPMIHTPVFLTKKTDMWTQGASHMCNVHNALFRGFNSIYLQAPYVSEVDKPDFLGYCKTWCKFLKTHTNEEESGLFPMTETLLEDRVFEKMHQEHNDFALAVDVFCQYLYELKDPLHLSAGRMLLMMDDFKVPFEKHFRSEIDAIAALASHPKTPKQGSKEYDAAKANFDQWGEGAIVRGGITDVVMFFLFNLDRDFEDGLWRDWPEVPKPVRWVGSRVDGLPLLQ
ncbi:hypothetical protein NM208_g1769 [Fusarium decemcellulare]|uniref:Uncharacterized protein n=1 Tax=Fusarium decemcellulare TaxID=57161 RepID=A0ACC1SUZ5_9HYPO|nr:hypothetical protein NM208_g1769 [Fusarium decemcellulare]